MASFQITGVPAWTRKDDAPGATPGFLQEMQVEGQVPDAGGTMRNVEVVVRLQRHAVLEIDDDTQYRITVEEV